MWRSWVSKPDCIEYISKENGKQLCDDRRKINNGDLLNDQVKRLHQHLWTTSEKTYRVDEQSTTLGDPRWEIETGCAKVKMNPDTSDLRSG